MQRTKAPPKSRRNLEIKDILGPATLNLDEAWGIGVDSATRRHENLRYSRTNANHAAPFRHVQWRVGHGRSLELGNRGHIMAIANVTPDSFSDGGLYIAVA